MEKKSLLIKIWRGFGKLFEKVSWTEILIICVLIIISMTYIKVNIATYHVECDDGSIVEIHHGTNLVCDRVLEFNAWTGHGQVMPKLNLNLDFNLTK